MKVDIEKLFAPTSRDVGYEQTDMLKISLICRVDSYKFSHPFSYPKNIQAMSSYGEARVPRDVVITPFGQQILIKRYLRDKITMADIDAAEEFTKAHFGRPLFARQDWIKVLEVYNGWLPLVIRSVPEGTPMRGGQPIYTVSCFDPDLFWMSAGFETLIQRGVWYPTTIASRDRDIKLKIKKFYEQTGADMNLLPFSLHDFGGRGVSCAEQAEIGGAAHLVNFLGSDTVEGILAANFFYKTPMAGFSVYATEHSIECSFGSTREDAKRYLAHQLANAVPGSIISIVIDGYDVFREAELLCTEFRDQIIASKAKIVFRPDSGDMMEVVPRILKLQEMAFGYDLTSTGHKQIRHVGLIQGDGVDPISLIAMLGKICNMGYAASCMVFGSGGALLQKVNRDTLSFAQKACAILVDGAWKGVAKDPVTDHGKRSKEGVLTLVRSKATGELSTVRLDLGPLNEEFEDMHRLIYHCGKLFNETTMDEVRERSAI